MISYDDYKPVFCLFKEGQTAPADSSPMAVSSQTPTEVSTSSQPSTPVPKVLKVVKIVRTGNSPLLSSSVPPGSPLLLSSAGGTKPIIIVRKSALVPPSSSGVVTSVVSSTTSSNTTVTAAPTTQLSNFVAQTVGGGVSNGGNKPTPVKQVTFKGENVYFGPAKSLKPSSSTISATADSSDSEIEYIGTVDRFGRNLLTRNPHVRTAAGKKALEESLKKPNLATAVETSSKLFKKDFWMRAGVS